MTNNNQHIPSGYKPSPLGIIPEDWDVKRLGDCFDICAGRDLVTETYSPIQTIKHQYPIFSNSLENKGLYGYTSTPRHKANSITITGRGSLGHAEYREQDFDAIIRLLVLTPKMEISCELITNYINFSQPFIYESTGVPQLTAPQIQNTKLLLPPYKEQLRIMDILHKWDTAISKQTALIEKLTLRKRGLMQQLLTGKKRLKGFSGEWKEVKFKDIFLSKKQINKYGNDIDVLSVTKDGIFSQKEYFNKDIASEDTSKYLLVEKGDLAMSGLNFWMGSCYILTKYERGIISPAYKVFSIQDGFDLDYIVFFVQSHSFKSSLLGSSVVGASIVRRNLDMEMLEEWRYLFPSLTEQKAISTTLNNTDKEIELANKKLVRLQEEKRGLMQQLLTGKKRIKK